MIFAEGFQKLTLLDYPGRLAATVFAEGCNFRCPFCHNASLVTGTGRSGAHVEQQVLEHLKKRKGRLSGLCVTGGEPLIQGRLHSFLTEVKELGYDVKLDTNGSFPEELESLLSDGLVDCVAVDIKNAPGRYAATAGLPPQAEEGVLRLVEQSVLVALVSGADVEFRTTVVREFHRRDDLVNLARWLAHQIQRSGRTAPAPYYLQTFIDSGDLIEPGWTAYAPEEMESLRRAVLPHIPDAHLRGI